MKLLKQDGLSIKPIIILLAVLGGITYYMMKDIQELQTKEVVKTPAAKTNVTIEPKQAVKQEVGYTNVMKQVTEGLKDPAECGQAFKTASGGFAKYSSISDLPVEEDIHSVLIKGQKVLSINMEVGEFTLTDIYLKPRSNTAPITVNNLIQHEVDLQLVWKPKNSSEDVDAPPINLKILVDTTTGQIVACGDGLANPVPSAVVVQPVVTPTAPSSTSSISTTQVIMSGTICGVVTYECNGTFYGDNAVINPSQAIAVDSAPCGSHYMNTPTCRFVDLDKGFKLEGTTCSDGHRAIIHSGYMTDSENGEGAGKTTRVTQSLMVLCVKQ